MSRLFVCILLLALAAEARAQSGCPTINAARLHADYVQHLRTAMRKVTIGEMDTELPPAVQNLMPQLKAALAATITAVLACSGPAIDVPSTTSTLAQLLHANPPEPAPGTSVRNDDPRFQEAISPDYGANLQIHLSRLTPTQLAVTSSFTVECGNDTLWQLFALRDGPWTPQLNWYAPAYSSIDRAFGDFFLTALMPATAAHPLRVVAAHGHPWCTSRFSGFSLDVLEPTADPDHPRLLWHTDRGYSRGDFPITLKATANTFELRVHVPAWDATDYERLAIYRYRLEGNTPHRIQPIAANAQGFVDEWIDFPWAEAAAQSAPEHLAALKLLHQQLADPAKFNPQSYLSKANGPVRACIEHNLFQVEIDSSRELEVAGKPGGRSIPLPPTYFFLMESSDGYRLLNATHTADTHCSGPNLTQPKTPR